MKSSAIMVLRRFTIFLLAFAYLALCTATIITNASDSLNAGDQLNFVSFLCSANKKYCMTAVVYEDSSLAYLSIFEIADHVLVVWVGNRNEPFVNKAGVWTLDNFGALKILPQGGEPINIYSPPQPTNNIKATLQETGNLVLQELNPNGSINSLLWQSFDYPTDNLLPGMKLGVNHRTGQNWSLVSFLTESSPASGPFTLEWDPKRGELIIKRRGQIYWASGMLINQRFQYIPEEVQAMYYYTVVSDNKDEEYFTYTAPNEDSASWTLRSNGQLVDIRGNYIARADLCYGYNIDGGGCQSWELPCCRHSGEVFDVRSVNIIKMENSILSSNQSVSLTISDCKDICWRNCSCFGFSNYYGNGTGCVFYNGQSWVDFLDAGDDSLHMLITAAPESHGTKKWQWITAGIVSAALFIFCAGMPCLAGKRRKLEDIDHLEDNQKKENSLRVFSYASVKGTTNDFSSENKIGQGGFGPVYKGKLKTGKEIAVKRLSRTSRQGVIEFKNELGLISELQHMNLVQLLGCCIDGDERILIYEYMPNRSLDFFLFDSTQRKLLDWKKRFNIIDGIAQGLLYLHKYSRLRVVHRDLKASNILLDENMNPKIADFGMATIFTQESEGNTSRIAGTRGYMPPEYVIEGVFSVKSDVYSFGVLMLEIISGRRNNSFNNDDQPCNLVGHAWELWNEGVGLNLMDPAINDSLVEVQVLRCIHIGLLCVEENAVDRPTMSDILSMLTNESTKRPQPKRPAFYFGRTMSPAKEFHAKPENYSINGLSISDISAR